MQVGVHAMAHWDKQEQIGSYRGYTRSRSSVFNEEFVGYCGGAEEGLPVGRWRTAPACCAAQSVILRGLCCVVPLHRLARAAQHVPSE